MHADPLSAYAYRWFGGFASMETIDRGFDFFWQHLRRLGEASDLVVSASANLSARLSSGGMAGVVTIPMGVEPGIFGPRNHNPAYRAELLAQCGLDPSATLLLGVGRYSTEKRWGMVIDAAISAGTRAQLALLLVGEGRNRRSLISRASGSPHVQIRGPLTDRRALGRLMASADVLVHGCEAETFCMVGAEARASGIAVIVPDRGGAADHADGLGSRRYRAADPRALRDAILAFVGTRDQQRTRGGLAELPRSMDQHFSALFAAYAAIPFSRRLERSSELRQVG
jgi:alpha-1,6-mannosyltransferase